MNKRHASGQTPDKVTELPAGAKLRFNFDISRGANWVAFSHPSTYSDAGLFPFFNEKGSSFSNSETRGGSSDTVFPTLRLFLNLCLEFAEKIP